MPTTKKTYDPTSIREHKVLVLPDNQTVPSGQPLQIRDGTVYEKGANGSFRRISPKAIRGTIGGATKKQRRRFAREFGRYQDIMGRKQAAQAAAAGRTHETLLDAEVGK